MRDIEGFINQMNPSLEKQLARNEESKYILDGVDMKDHKSVLHAIKENDDCLGKNVTEISNVDDNKLRKRTLFKKILEETFNGNKIVEAVLDSYIKKTAENENDAEYGIDIDFTGLISDDPQMQTTCVKELLELRAKAKGSKADTYSGDLENMYFSSLFNFFYF